MKMKIVISGLLLSLLLSGVLVFSQEKASKLEKVIIKTSAVCQQCKDRLEKNIAFEKGVRAVSLDLETKELTVEFRTGKNTKEGLKKAVTKVGYDADELEADPKAYEKLPACCKKDAPPH
ncbi:MAG: cation transporter [Bacteroidales bacterium]|nr:cation transporter [Bacteroidales bacterium]